MNTTSSSPLPYPSTSGHPGPHQSQLRVDASQRVPAGGRALILGGGGSTGNAWLIGVVAGLYDAGLDVTAADLTVGTSAGSTAAAQFAGANPAVLFDAILAAAPQRPSSLIDASGANDRARPVSDHMERTGKILEASADMADMRRRMGAAAIDMAAAMDGSSARWRATVAARLPRQEWTERLVLLTAVDAQTVKLWCSTAIAEWSWLTQWRPAAPVASPTLSAAITISTAATGPTLRMQTWQPGTAAYWCCLRLAAGHGLRWSGACTYPGKWTNCGVVGAGLRQSSLTARRSTCSASMRWI